MIFSDLATPPLGSALSLFPSLLFFSLSLSLSVLFRVKTTTFKRREEKEKKKVLLLPKI